MMKHLPLAVSAFILLNGCGQWTTYSPNAALSSQSQPSRPVAVMLEKGAFTKGFDAIKAGDYASAETLIGQHVQENPEDPYGLLAMGKVMAETDRPEDALTYYRLAARYGTIAPVGEVVAAEGASAKTITDLALRNISALEGTAITQP